MPRGHFCRVEPPPTPGIPDLNYCVETVEGWIELKTTDRGRFPFARKGLRLSQRRWIKQRLAAGGRIFVFAAMGSKVVVFRGAVALTIEKTTTREEFLNRALVTFPRRDNAETRRILREVLLDKV